MAEIESSYRPHNPGHDYYAPGIYLITLVVRDRERQSAIFGRLNDDIRKPDTNLTALGKAVMEEWKKIPSFEESKGRRVKIHAAVCMPDHFHGVLEVKERMDKSVGQVVWGFKVACTKRWRQLQPPEPRTAQERTESRQGTAQERMTGQPSLVASTVTDAVPDLHRMSKKQRAEYYARHPEMQRPLFDDNYDDTICITDPATGIYSERHLKAMVHYVDDNARRAIIRRMRPEYMRRCLHIELTITGRDGRQYIRQYAAFGNLFLLRWARKVQVFCHRRARYGMLTAEERAKAGISYNALPNAETSVHYEQTEHYRNQCREWKRQVMEGATVIVTPGISAGELNIKNRCIESCYPLIHLQKEPIGRYWKPEQSRFDACTKGSLLILAPWQPEELGEVNGVPSDTDYSVFHNLNKLAEEICLFEGEAKVIQ